MDGLQWITQQGWHKKAVEYKEDRAGNFLLGRKDIFMSETKIVEEDNLKCIAETMNFSYREVWVMSLFVREEMLEAALECVTIFETSVGEYLSSVGAAPDNVIHYLLNPEDS